MRAALRQVLLGGGWRLRGATADLDFANSRYYGGSLASLLSTTRASVKWYVPSTGAAAFSVSANTAAIGCDGLTVHEARSTLANKSRRLDDGAQWTLSNVATSAVAGIDQVLATATRLTASAGNATCLGISNTAASAACRVAPYVRRVSGTGNIDLTLDGGSTWNTLVGITSSFSRLGIGQTLANPRIGIRIVSSGDSVDIDFANGETGSFDTPPIESASAPATQNADNVQAAGVLLAAFKLPAASVVINAGPLSNHASGAARVVGSTSTFQALPYIATAISFGIYNGASALTALGNNISSAQVRMGISWNASGRSVVASNGTVSTDANVQVSDAAYFLGSGTGGANFIDGYISRLTVFNSRLSDAQLKAFTQ